jgi:hypothetical protein
MPTQYRTELVRSTGLGAPQPLPPPTGQWLNSDNGRIQYGFLDPTTGAPLEPVFELEYQGGKWQLLMLGNPGGPVALAADGKAAVSR